MDEVLFKNIGLRKIKQRLELISMSNYATVLCFEICVKLEIPFLSKHCKLRILLKKRYRFKMTSNQSEIYNYLCLKLGFNIS